MDNESTHELVKTVNNAGLDMTINLLNLLLAKANQVAFNIDGTEVISIMALDAMINSMKEGLEESKIG